MKTPETGSASHDPQQKKSNYKNVLIGFLSLAIIGLLVFTAMDTRKDQKGQISTQQTGYQKEASASLTADEEIALRKSFDESLARIDSLNAINESLNTQLSEKNKEIEDSKAEIRSVLNSKNVTASELTKAKSLIGSLNDKIASMEQEMAKLTQDNQSLKQENEKLNQDLTTTKEINTQLTAKVDVGSTLNASNMKIIPVKIKRNDKEKVTYAAKRVDKLVVSFDVSNRIADPGTKVLYVVITGPDGKLITGDQFGSGTFTTREEGDKMFTTKVPVDIETAKMKQVEYYFKPGTKFARGNYHIQIYQNGFMIGEGTSVLKKGGLFS